nr:hypothetical protein [Burkholderia contaminans]
MLLDERKRVVEPHQCGPLSGRLKVGKVLIERGTRDARALHQLSNAELVERRVVEQFGHGANERVVAPLKARIGGIRAYIRGHKKLWTRGFVYFTFVQ